MLIRRRTIAMPLAAAAFFFGVAAPVPAADRYEQLAQHVVGDVLATKPGDVVLITSSVQNMELIEDLMRELRKAGAWPITNIQSDRVSKAYFEEVSPQYDSQSPAATLRLASIISAQINVDWEQDPRLLQHISATRQSTIAQAFNPVTSYFVSHSIPYVEIGNGLYPSKYTATQYGISKTRLADLFWNGVNADYGSLHDDAQAVARRVGNASAIHVTAPNGTDVTFGGRGKMVISDGALPPPSARKSGALVYAAIPAGEVVFGPAGGSANGWIRFDPVFVNNTEVDGMTMRFVNGKMVSMTAKTGLAAVKPLYDAGTAGKDDLTFADLGINRGVAFVEGSKMFAPMAAGMVTLGTGNDLALGGSNASTFNFSGYIAGANVWTDGHPLIVNGKLATQI